MGQTNKEMLGRKGEKLALKHLKKLGYRYITKNYRTTMGEIDLIMQQGENLVFVEVKTRQDENFAKAEDAINFRKRKKLSATAHHFIQTHQLQQSPCRFDTVAVVIGDKAKPIIRHQVNAFGPC